MLAWSDSPNQTRKWPALLVDFGELNQWTNTHGQKPIHEKEKRDTSLWIYQARIKDKKQGGSKWWASNAGSKELRTQVVLHKFTHKHHN